MNDLIIRKATIKDAYDIEYIGATSWYESYQEFMPITYLKERINTIKNKITRCEEYLKNHSSYYIAIYKNKTVGILDIKISTNTKYKNYGYIESLYVLKEYQRLGIGKHLLKTAIEYFQKQNINNVYLECIDNGPATNFYKKYNGKIVDKIDYPIRDFSVKANIFIFENIKRINL